MIKLKFWVYSILTMVFVGALFVFTTKASLGNLELAAQARLERAVVRLARVQSMREASELDYLRRLSALPEAVDAVQAARRLGGNPPSLAVTRLRDAIGEVPLPPDLRPAIEILVSTPGGASRSRVGEAVEEGVAMDSMPWLTAVHAGNARATMVDVGEASLQIVVAAPVQSGAQPLGGLTLYFPVDAGLLTTLRSRVGVDLTVARGLSIVAASGERDDSVKAVAAARKASPDEAVAWGSFDDLKILSFLEGLLRSPLPVGYARKVPLQGVADGEIIATVEVADAVRELDEVAVVWAGGEAALLLLALIWGFFVASGAGGKWAKRLSADLERAVAGDLSHRLEARRYSRAFRPVAEAINATLEGAASRSPGLADQVMAHRDADIGAVLGDHPSGDDPQPSDFTFPGEDPAGAPGAGLQAPTDDEIEPVAAADLPAAGGSDAGFDPFGGTADEPPSAEPPASEGAAGFDPFGGGDEPAPPPAVATPPAPPPAASASFDPFGGDDPAPAPSPPPPPPPAAVSDDPFAAEMSAEASPGDYFSDSTRVVNLNEMAAQAKADQAGAPAPADDPFASAYGDDGPIEHEGHDATVVAKVPDALLAATARAQSGASTRDPDEEHFRQVFQDFVATRRQCGEAAEGLTFEKFSAKLRKNRDTIKDKHAARSVRFQVYVKAGKAALKATPVK